ncbi:maleylpyruvate isomerase family mycothiol-dependent enzyme [Nocardia callitridis]|uniref:Maleylpyruvate isomerase family mycothiol-dependent enzyme n=1 Tax=Nocardia callitridis TaxID=648753 RepID=A0ABP9KJQ1_9NOCA
MNKAATMSTDEIWRAVVAERTSLIGLLETLTESQWERASLCAGWRVRDVVAHIVQSSDASIGWILLNVIRARGNFDRAVRDSAIRHADQVTTARLLDELRDRVELRVSPGPTTPVDRLMDLLVHGQDIAGPLGIDRDMPVDAARSAIDRVWTSSAPFGARKKFRNYRLVATDVEWTAGDGLLVEGPVSALLLLVTGRRISLGSLAGAGAAELIAGS